MGEMRIFDLRNEDVVIFFGDEYCHCYYKGNAEHIMADIEAFEKGEDPASWDGNEMDQYSLEQYEEDSTIDEIRKDELLANLERYIARRDAMKPVTPDEMSL